MTFKAIEVIYGHWVYFKNDCFILQTNIQIDKMGLQALLPSYLISLEKDLFLVQDTDPNTIWEL